MEIAIRAVVTMMVNQGKNADETLFCLIQIGLPLNEVVVYDGDTEPRPLLCLLLDRTHNPEFEKILCKVLVASNYKLN